MLFVRYQIKIQGRVQGVGYRYFCKSCADCLNISGWVRNSIDGTVELEAQGSLSDITSFLHKLNKGPTFSRVLKTDKVEMEARPEETAFVIKY